MHPPKQKPAGEATAMGNDNDDDETQEVAEGRSVNEEYKIWKKNIPFLYDMILIHALEWPSLTVEWLPTRMEPPGKEYAVQKMILGTHTAPNERNYLLLAEVQLPREGAEYDPRHQYNDADSGKIRIVQQINHEGEINRARHMPQNQGIIATKTVSAEVHVFNFRKHPSRPRSDSDCKPDLRLKGHKDEGFGLSWNNFKPGILLSGSDDSQICLWDINAAPKKMSLSAIQTFNKHEGPVGDVAWHLMDEHLFCSVGEDKYLHLWDIRTPVCSKPILSITAHQSEVNCLDFNPRNKWIVATGSNDKTVKLFDLRKISTALHTLRSHKKEVFQVGWKPKNESVLASSGLDRELLIWDTGRIGQNQEPKHAQDGPPELLFIHGGHTSSITDFSWNPRDDWVIASVAEDNIVQVWKMPESIYLDDDDNELPPDGHSEDERLLNSCND